MFGFGVDVQIGVPRAWSVIASISLIIGSVWLYDGFDQSWITLLVGIGGVISAMVLGMPIMVRTRFSTPAIDREWLIGERGEAVTSVDPDGVVNIDGALWRAAPHGDAKVAINDTVEVVETDGVLLKVVPVSPA